MPILPNLQLLAIEDATASAHHRLSLRIDGSVTEYRDQNYLLISDVADESAHLRPQGGPAAIDLTSGQNAVAPNAAPLELLRQGTNIADRQVRFQRGVGGQVQVIFDSDGRDMQDPPMILLPNLKLALMENNIAIATADPRFRVSGQVMEYRGRNYLLLDKAIALSETNRDF